MIINDFIINERLLEKKQITRCQLATCKGGCCADGVWLDVEQAERILDHAEMIKPFMPEDRRDQSTWFAELHDDDPSFPSGKYTGTTTVTDAAHPSGSCCRFLRPQDHFCAIQFASVQNGLKPWDLKPLYCCLYPVVDEYEGEVKTLTLDSDNDLFSRGGGCHDSCAGEPTAMFQVYAEEVSIMLGVEGYRELCLHEGVAARL